MRKRCVVLIFLCFSWFEAVAMGQVAPKVLSPGGDGKSSSSTSASSKSGMCHQVALLMNKIARSRDDGLPRKDALDRVSKLLGNAPLLVAMVSVETEAAYDSKMTPDEIQDSSYEDCMQDLYQKKKDDAPSAP